ncbi:YpmS family protein [Bacillus xiapuensis]|uniref:YpmS family protein n=1 Tax=Bacillus xiapuensis TaxID=2014075 RepID=UPI000C23C415|nr:YpmS family protein [Bacillus xiapuensis]
MKLGWKHAFIGLLAINVLIVAILLAGILSPIKDQPIRQTAPGKENVKFHVQANKEDLNQLINKYMKKGINNNLPVDYNVYLRDQVEMYGHVSVFSERIDYKMTFEPKALKNGNIVLKQKELKVGKINLPVSYVLKAARDNYSLPDWVQILPNDKMIYLSLDKMKLDSGLQARAERFDLKKDDIRFTLMLPAKEQ